MRLEDYWGIGPKTREVLVAELGEEAAIEAVESANGRALVEAGLGRGRATRILRRVHGGEGLEMLATGDAREVYRELVERVADHAVTADAADRIRVLTPLTDRAAVESRLEEVTAATAAWTALAPAEREAVLDAFSRYESDDSTERAAVEAALALRATGASEGPFARLADLDADALRDAADALGALDGERVVAGTDADLDHVRDALEGVERLASRPEETVAAVRDSGVRGTGDFREAFVSHVADESGVAPSRVREVLPEGAADAATFVDQTLRALTGELREAADEREASVRAGLEATIEAAREDVDAAVAAVGDVAFWVSLARFADAFDLTRPVIVEGETIAVTGARNLALAAREDVTVQPIDYAVGAHTLDGPPGDDRVAVLTGANSGGKTTVLETLCQVALLASMGLPVPADACEVSLVDSVVFHRRHASFNAGVLEATLRSVVPPLAAGGRTLMLVDEFEAITEPGSAADLLHGLVTLTVDRDAAGVFVTHLADDLEPLPESARIDGIFAEGLTADLSLDVDYQPRFGTVGRSTPEFIVSRLVADAPDSATRMGFETLARAVGQEVVQRTLADARWSE